MGWRLRDVDPKGRLALVAHPIRAPRIVDLRQLRWRGESPIGLNLYSALKSVPPRLTSNGLLVHADISLINSDSTRIDGVRWHTLEGEHITVHANDIEGPHSCTVVSATDDVFAYVTETQRVIVMRQRRLEVAPPPAAALMMHPEMVTEPARPLRFTSHTCEPLPRKVISAIAIDGERDRLASATWREIAIHLVRGGTVELIDHFDTRIDANITWLALTGRWLAYGTGYRLEVRGLQENGTADSIRYHHEGVDAAAISRDGSYLAFARGSDLIVHDLDRDEQVEFTEHSDGINYVRFASDDHMLISGDNDNRIVMRPRTETGYAKPIVDVELATA
jgi:hypothetical protein